MSAESEERFHEDVTLEEQDPMLEDELGDVEFADNPEPRCPVLIIADCSGSMSRTSHQRDEPGRGRPVPSDNRR